MAADLTGILAVVGRTQPSCGHGPPPSLDGQSQLHRRWQVLDDQDGDGAHEVEEEAAHALVGRLRHVGALGALRLQAHPVLVQVAGREAEDQKWRPDLRLNTGMLLPRPRPWPSPTPPRPPPWLSGWQNPVWVLCDAHACSLWLGQGYTFSLNWESTLKEWHPEHMPKDFVHAGVAPRGRKKFTMPTRAMRTFNLLTKYKDMGQLLERPFPEGTEPTEIVTFLISSLFDMYQISALELTFRTSKAGARSKAMCYELLGFTPPQLEALCAFRLDNFLQRNDEKRMSVLKELALRVWEVIKGPVYVCPVPDVEAAERELAEVTPADLAARAQAEVQATQPAPEPEAKPAVDRATLDRKLRGTWSE